MEPRSLSPLLGIFWMLVTGLCFVTVTALVKYMGNAVPAAQAAFLRYLLGLVFLVPMIRPILRARLSRRQLGLFGLRGIAHTGGVALWFFAMTQIPIADVTAMNYLAPIYVTIGAALFLGEHLATRRILAILIAFAGALIILRPGIKAIDPGHIAMLGTGLLFGASYLIAKVMSGQVSAAVVVGMLSVTVTIGLAPLAWTVWVPVAPRELMLLFAVAVFATAGHYTMTLAFSAAPLTVTQPVTFLQLVWAVLLGALVFAEPVDMWVVIGGAVVIGSISFMTWREARVHKSRVTPSVPETKT